MSLNSTVYDVQVKYSLDDKASDALAHLGGNADKAEKSVGGLKESLKGLAELFLAREAFHFGKEFFVDANSEMEQLKIGMAAVAGFQLNVPFDRASASTDRLIAGWQQFSKQTTLTTKQFVEFGRNTMAGVFNAGAGEKEYDQFVKRAAVVGNIMSAGHAGGLQYAATEFNEALMGNLRKTQMLNMQLLRPMAEKAGKDLESWWGTLTPQERLNQMMKAFNDPAWDAAINKQKDSFAGVTSTLKDNLEIAAREIGLPLFKEITKEVQKWNKWIDENPAKIQEFASKFATGLVDGFHAVQDAVGFVVDNKEALFRLAELWLAIKGMSLVGDLAGGVGGLVRSGAGALGKGASVAQGLGLLGRGGMAMETSLLSAAGETAALGAASEGAAGTLATVAGLAGPIGLVVAGLGTFYAALKVGDAQAGSAAQNELAVDNLKNYLNTNTMTIAGEENTKTSVFDWLQAHGSLKTEGEEQGVDFKKLDEELIRLGELDTKNRDSIANMAEKVINSMSDDEWNKRLGRNQPPKNEDPIEGGKKRDAKNVNVTIHRIEVAAPDPDRFAFNFNRAMSRIAVNRTQAQDALRGGA